MKRVRQPDDNRSLAGSSFDSSDEDETRSFCYSPQDEDQRRRFCDLVALALASSRDYGSSQPQSASWEGNESDSESHPSLESDAEAELLELIDGEDENESGCYVESELSSSPSVDGSFESYEATVIQNRKLSLLNRQQRRQSAAFRATNSFCTNHANLLSPDLMVLAERLAKENRRNAPKEKMQGKKDQSTESLKGAEPPICDIAHRSRSANCENKDQPLGTPDKVERNASVMDQLRKIVYKKYESITADDSEAESIRSSILPLSPSLLLYREALRLSACAHEKSPEITESPRTELEGINSAETSTDATLSLTVSGVCDSAAASAPNPPAGLQELKRPAPEPNAHGAIGSGGGMVNDARQPTEAANQNSRPASMPFFDGNVVTGVVTRSMLRNSNRVLHRPKTSRKLIGKVHQQSQTSELSNSGTDFTGSARSMDARIDATEPTIPVVGVNVKNSDNEGSNAGALTPVVEENGCETAVTGVETALTIICRVGCARTVQTNDSQQGAEGEF